MAEYVDKVKLMSRIESELMRWGEKEYNALQILGDIEDFPTADVAEVPKWIDVKERLPERDGEAVLCYVKNSSTEGVTYVVGCIQQQKHWFLQTCNIGLLEFPNHYWKVTHWMPLPEPPG